MTTATINPPSISLALLKKFCGTDETRIVLTEPFSDDTYTYATDGRILIRVAKMDHAPSPEDRAVSTSAGNKTAEMLKRVQELFTVDNCDGNFMELPKEPEDGWGELCGTCGGSMLTKHLACEYCGCLNEDALPYAVTCTDCHDGRVFGNLQLPFGTQEINPVYVRKLAKLPNVKMACGKNPDPNGPPKDCSLTFTFDGGEGRLMPMKTNK